jgi:hypothetical protein
MDFISWFFLSNNSFSPKALSLHRLRYLCWELYKEVSFFDSKCIKIEYKCSSKHLKPRLNKLLQKKNLILSNPSWYKQSHIWFIQNGFSETILHNDFKTSAQSDQSSCCTMWECPPLYALLGTSKKDNIRLEFKWWNPFLNESKFPLVSTTGEFLKELYAL